MGDDISNYSTLNQKLILIIFGLSGMTALIYEIVWIRPLTVVFGSTIYAVSIIVASFLVGLALGSLIAGRYTDRLHNPLRYYGFIEIGIGLYGLMLISIFAVLPALYLSIYKATFSNLSLFFFLQMILSFTIILIPTTLMGATLPIVMKSFSKKFESVGKDLGKLYSVNNFGAVIGTLVAGFLLIPLIGIKDSIIIAAIINVIIGLVLLYRSKSLTVKKLIGIIIVTIALASLVDYDYERLSFGMYSYADPSFEIKDFEKFLKESEFKFFKDGLYSTVAVVSNDKVDFMLKTGKSQCSNDPATLKSMQRLAYLPYNMFENNYETPTKALNVGLGCGITSEWLSERIDTTTIEIDPTIVEASKFFYDEIDHQLIVDDARNWLLRNDVKYDIIVTQPSDPFAGAWTLFTKEYFELLNQRVTENGIVSQWVPIFIMSVSDFDIYYNTFHSVFPYVYIYQMKEDSGQLIFLGSQNQLKIDDPHLYLLNNEDIPYIETELNTDDRPILEFSTAINVYNENPFPILEKINEWKKSK